MGNIEVNAGIGVRMGGYSVQRGGFGLPGFPDPPMRRNTGVPYCALRGLTYGASIIQRRVPADLSGSLGDDSKMIFVPSGDQAGAPSYPL